MPTPSTPLAHAPTCFGDLGVPAGLTAVLERMGIVAPFAIQAATLPESLTGRDVCGMAPTGAGKTLAFGLAILSRLTAQPRPSRRDRRDLWALVLVPTRELAAQIESALTPIAAAIGARVASAYGGVGYGKQLADLRRGVDVLVACPGRLTDLVERGSVDLSKVAMVVVDEADRMADMGFLPVVRRLIDRTPPTRQTLLFSATLEGPVDRLIQDYQHDPVRHEVAPDNLTQGDVQHHFWRVEAHDRVSIAAASIAACGPAIVFCRTKRGVDRLSGRFTRLGLQSAAIHGDRSQAQRERALASFRTGRLDVLVATDVAARGIHVEGVPLVLQFDPPADPTDYVHRAGRTGRAGAGGVVVSLVGGEHLAGTKLIQRKLGLPHRVSSPDVGALAPVVDASRTGGRRPSPRETTRAPMRDQEPPIVSPRGTPQRRRPDRQRRRSSHARHVKG